MGYKETEDELNWCQHTTNDSSLHPGFELCALVGFMKQELIRLADLNDKYEAYLKEIKNE